MELLRLLPKPFVKRGQGVAALEGLHQRILPFLSQGPAIRLPDPRRGQSPPRSDRNPPGTNIATHRLLFQISM